MRLEPANAIPRLPLWAAGIISSYLAIVVFATCSVGPIKPIFCGFRLLTGAPCPGCGSTRMVLALLELRIVDAFHFNPLSFLLGVLGLILLVLRVAAGKRVIWIEGAGSRRVVVAVFIAAVLLNWAYVLSAAG